MTAPFPPPAPRARHRGVRVGRTARRSPGLRQSPTGAEFIRGDAQAVTVVISGELTLPRGASGRVPAVVLIHGSSGLGNNMPVWRSELTGIGVATFAPSRQ